MSHNIVNGFFKEYHFLSNYFPCRIEYKGCIFKCSEALFMAHKSGDESDFARFSQYDAPTAKAEGKKVILRLDWDTVKFDIMRNVIKLKFDQNPKLMEQLISTSPMELREENNWNDKIWGTCNGIGENNLGKILMELRDQLLENE